MVVDMVISSGSFLAYLNSLLQEVVSLLREPCWRADIVHAYREANRCADFLAKKGHLVSSYDWVVLESVCPGLGILLADDVRGSVLPR